MLPPSPSDDPRPESRFDIYRGPADDPAPREGGWVASVAVILRPGSTGDEILLIQRADFDADPWSGHMAFPGGRREDVDRSLLDTAMRETREETGIDLATRGTTLGRLPVVEPESVRLPTLSILPLVFSVPGSTMARAVSEEVADALWIPVPTLTDPARTTVHSRPFEDRVLTFPAIGLDDRVIWGLTRRILRDLFQRMA